MGKKASEWEAWATTSHIRSIILQSKYMYVKYTNVC